MTTKPDVFGNFKATLEEDKKAEFQAFWDYCRKAYVDPKTSFIKKYKPEELIALWRTAQSWRMNLDGRNCWFDRRSGIFFNYIAMKQSVQKLYPMCRFDVQFVLKDDEFSCGRTEKGVTYEFKKKDPFEDLNFELVKAQQGYTIKPDTNFKGAFGVFVANDGTGTEVLELLAPKDLQEIVQSASNVYNWNKYPGEFITKTVFKRVCKRAITDDRGVQSMIDFDNAVNGNDFKNKEPKQISEEDVQKILDDVIIAEQQGEESN